LPANGGTGKRGKGKSSWWLDDEGGTEDEDNRWKFVGDHSRRPAPDPAVDLCPFGAKSKF